MIDVSFQLLGRRYFSINTLKTNELSFYNEFGILTLNAKQFDTGRIFIFDIMDNDEPFDLTDCDVYLRIAKADGTQFQGHECCLIDKSSIIVNTAIGNGDQILTAPGINKCELHLEDSSGLSLTTWTFNIHVEKRVHDGSNISSINSYDNLDNMIKMEKERVENEQIRIDNENKRIENEVQRILDENERQISESERKNTFESVLSEAQLYVENASNHADNASKSEINATKSENNAGNYALEAESWAHGKTNSRENEDIDNSEYWCKLAETYNESSKEILAEAINLLEKTKDLLEESFEKFFNITFEVNDDGELEYYMPEGSQEINNG